MDYEPHKSNREARQLDDEDRDLSEPSSVAQDDPVREELIAYLDGELQPGEAERIERQLASDEQYRARMAELQWTWDMLEHLPRAQATDTFTQSTLEMVALTAKRQVVERQHVHRRRQIGLTVICVIAATFASLGGYAVIASMLAAPNRQLERDLPVIENVDLYRNADSIKFLERLAEEGLFDESLASLNGNGSESGTSSTGDASDDAPEERQP